MPDWFIMVVIASKLMLVGPFTDDGCQAAKRLMFSGTAAVCIERGMIDGKRAA